jgi:hypothetical protein
MKRKSIRKFIGVQTSKRSSIENLVNKVRTFDELTEKQFFIPTVGSTQTPACFVPQNKQKQKWDYSHQLRMLEISGSFLHTPYIP